MCTLKLYLVQESDPVLFGIMMTAVLDRAPTPVLEAVHEFANFVKYGGLQSSQFPAFVQFLRARRPCVSEGICTNYREGTLHYFWADDGSGEVEAYPFHGDLDELAVELQRIETQLRLAKLVGVTAENGLCDFLGNTGTARDIVLAILACRTPLRQESVQDFWDLLILGLVYLRDFGPLLEEFVASGPRPGWGVSLKNFDLKYGEEQSIEVRSGTASFSCPCELVIPELVSLSRSYRAAVG